MPAPKPNDRIPRVGYFERGLKLRRELELGSQGSMKLGRVSSVRVDYREACTLLFRLKSSELGSCDAGHLITQRATCLQHSRPLWIDLQMASRVGMQ